ncbi:MAG: endonuclease/exonuclease/phosphatase family protein [Clostridia bacterium]|nr:endonuclease/exonuclease/phosphatase family protein [Clostridia bacterium]MDQ7792348.1 endonuclease/exonuclease/phosphatase family protein [Clostridia bacterium]
MVIKVMTRNLYFGASAARLKVSSLPDVPARVADMWQMILANDFPARAKALANEIAVKQPHLVGLQEATLLRVRSPGLFLKSSCRHIMSPNKLLQCHGLLMYLLFRRNKRIATTVACDFLDILLGELRSRGLRYTPAAVWTGTDIEAPSATGDDVRLTDRTVIIARSDLPPGELTLSNPQTKDFTSTFLPLIGGLLTMPIRHGWASVDVTIRDRSFRFLATHLDADSPAIQAAQARELLRGPCQTELPLVLVGDFNSKAVRSGEGTYDHLIAGGYVDAWTVAGSGDGFTAWQDENLLNPVSRLDRRIDLILYRGGFQVQGVEVVGAEPDDRIPEGLSPSGRLWPSDHAGVVATLRPPP